MCICIFTVNVCPVSRVALNGYGEGVSENDRVSVDGDFIVSVGDGELVEGLTILVLVRSGGDKFSVTLRRLEECLNLPFTCIYISTFGTEVDGYSLVNWINIILTVLQTV